MPCRAGFTWVVTAALLVVTIAAVSPAEARRKRPSKPRFEPHVVVATLDTGTNPFHPTWRRDQFAHPSRFIPGYPRGAEAVELTFLDDFKASVRASADELKKFSETRYPYWIPGTNIIGTWAGSEDARPVFDQENHTSPSASHAHGASASSQISGLGYGMAPDTFIVIMDRTEDEGDGAYPTNGEGLRWAADQPWIDIIHTNIQDFVPLNDEEGVLYKNYPDAVRYAVSKGKLVISAGGNWYAEPTETSPHAGPSGVLVAGANDNCGYTDFSNPDPHVVMDGAGTIAAAPDGYEDRSFGGTSSASPRITGYAASLLLRIRRHFSYRENMRGDALVVVDDRKARPRAGPLKDGTLTAAELHEVVRKTADPNPHDSQYDGARALNCVPQPIDLPWSFYPKMGYGEVSEHTIDAAFEVAVGISPMPERPMEDDFYERSEQLREMFW